MLVELTVVSPSYEGKVLVQDLVVDCLLQLLVIIIVLGGVCSVSELGTLIENREEV